MSDNKHSRDENEEKVKEVVGELDRRYEKSFEIWFYRRMIQELEEMACGQKTNSISYIVSMLKHDFPELKGVKEV